MKRASLTTSRYIPSAAVAVSNQPLSALKVNKRRVTDRERADSPSILLCTDKTMTHGRRNAAAGSCSTFRDHMICLWPGGTLAVSEAATHPSGEEGSIALGRAMGSAREGFDVLVRLKWELRSCRWLEKVRLRNCCSVSLIWRQYI